MTTIADVAQVVNRAAADPAFRQRLLSAPAATLLEAGIDVPAGTEVRVLENTDRLRHMVLPEKPEGFVDDEAGTTPGAPTSDVETLHAHARLVIDSWSDAGLKARLLSDPAAVLAERGIALPDGVGLRVVEASDGTLYLVLPPSSS